MTTLALSGRDLRPLHPTRTVAASPLTSPTFWLAGALVLPVAGLARLLRGLRRLA